MKVDEIKKIKQIALELVGKNFDDVILLYDYKILRRDEKSYWITSDVRNDRILIEIDNNIITKAYVG